jgi:hypothetical protein
MGIDPMNNISNNNKNTLCSYIISTPGGFGSHLFVVFMLAWRRAHYRRRAHS